MAEADTRGSDGRGIFRLPQYIRRIKAGGINLRPDISVAQDRAATAVIDGDNAMGHLTVRRATELALAKAKEYGIGWVGARHSNHAGPAALYACMVLAHDVIGLYLAVGNAYHLPPWGGTELLLSTNPIAIAVPGRDRPPMVLDMAATNAAYGKVKVKAQRNEPMPQGWMVDREGQPLTDPHRANEGFLLPIGGAKGHRLALMFGLLAGSRNGAALSKEVVDFNADVRSVPNTGHAIMAFDIGAFGDVDAVRAKVDETWRLMQASPTLPAPDAVRLASRACREGLCGPHDERHCRARGAAAFARRHGRPPGNRVALGPVCRRVRRYASLPARHTHREGHDEVALFQRLPTRRA